MIDDLKPAEIEALLKSELVARIGCHAGDTTYVVPITYAYDGEGIIGHSFVGMKVNMMRENPRVCVEIDHMDDPSNWQSVIAWGDYEELTGDDAKRAMSIMMERFASLMTSATSQPGDAAHGVDEATLASGEMPEAVIYRIRLTAKTGRFERP
ncbi:MAG: pyridoxamine 5'-phosphate oxidase family protein [Chromatiales bacterium]|nr:MAG: pyridoxamine 5'-phosphate oxidase family protein [Chromatiales bacterium]